MIRPLSQSQLQNISAPGQQQINQLNQTLQHVGQVNRQSRLDKLQETAFNSQQKAAQGKLFKDNAPIIHAGLTQLSNLPAEQRFEAAKTLFKDVPGISELIDDPEDFTDESLSRNLGLTGQLLAKNKQGPITQGQDADGPGFFERTNGRLRRIEGARPQTKAPLVSINNTAQSESQKVVGKGRGEAFNQIQTDASSALDKQPKIQRMKQLIDTLETGASKPIELALKKTAKGLGIDLEQFNIQDDIGRSEALQAVAVEFQLDAVAKTKGAVSEKEMELFGRTAQSLGKSKEANQLILEMQQVINKRAIQRAVIARQSAKKDPSLESLRDDLLKYSQDNPLFNENLIERAKSLSETEINPQQTNSLLNPEEQTELETLRKRFVR